MNTNEKEAATSAKATTPENCTTDQHYHARTKQTRLEKIAERRQGIPKLYQALYDRAASGQASPRQAIKSHCLECVCWQRKEISLCSALACPLYLYRPFQDPTTSPTGPGSDSATDDLMVEG